MNLLTGISVFLLLVCGTYAGNSKGQMMFHDDDIALDLVELEQYNFWTEWLNGDSPLGTGDYENVKTWWNYYNFRSNGHCGMKCPDPLAMEWDLVDRSDSEVVEYIDKCVVIDIVKMKKKQGIYPGLNCMNSKQDETSCTVDECRMAHMRTDKREYKCDLCPNFKVRYLCPIEYKTDTRALSYDCGNENKRELDLQALDLKLNEATGELEEKENEAFEEEERALRAEIVLEQQREEKESVKAEEDKEYRRLLGLLQTYLDENE